MRWCALVLVAGCVAETASAPDLASPDLAQPDLWTAPDLASARALIYVSGSPTIARFELDLSTGNLTALGTTPTTGNPSFLAFNRSFLYAADEANSRVRAFSIGGDGALSALNAVSSEGSGPAHLSIAGDRVLVANYDDGRVAALPIASDGSLAAAPSSLLAGANAHQILADGSDVYVPCKGADTVVHYKLQSGALTPSSSAAASRAGAGPRHIALRGGFAYVIEENSSTMAAYTRASDGKLTLLHSLSTLPAGSSGSNTGAEVVIFRDWLYGSNRGDDSIVQFALGSDGRMTLVGHTKTGGMTPRSFAIVGNFLLVANQGSNEVRVFSLDATGKPTATNVRVSAQTPAFVGAL